MARREEGIAKLVRCKDRESRDRSRRGEKKLCEEFWALWACRFENPQIPTGVSIFFFSSSV